MNHLNRNYLNLYTQGFSAWTFLFKVILGRVILPTNGYKCVVVTTKSYLDLIPHPDRAINYDVYFED